MDFKVGDKVRLLSGVTAGEKYDEIIILEQMIFEGNLTIIDVKQLPDFIMLSNRFMYPVSVLVRV